MSLFAFGVFAYYGFVPPLRLVLFVVAIIAIYALITSRSRRHYGHHRSLRCPRCGHHFPKLRNETSGQTVPEGGFVCEHCGCKMDEFGNELSFPADNDNPESW